MLYANSNLKLLRMIKKFILSLALAGLLFSASNAQVIFDPAVYPAENLPEGMSIVDVSGKMYLKIALDGWNTSINISPAVTIAPGHTHFWAEAMYEVGTSGYTIDQVNTFLKLADASWAEIMSSGAGSSVDASEYVVEDAFAGGEEVGVFQMAGQETTSWGAVAGDTMYVGRILAVQPGLLLDPVLAHDAYLPDGWEVEMVDDAGYFKIALNGWNSSYEFNKNYGTVEIPEGVTAIKAMAKYQVGTSGYTIDGINTFLKFADASWAEIVSAGAGSSETMAKYALPVTPGDLLGVFQVAGQETTSWGAVSGDTLWVGAWTPDMVESVAIEADGGATEISDVGGTLQLTAVVTPEDVYNDTVAWSVDDPAIATIDDTGLLTAVDDGDVTITATAEDGSGAEATIVITISGQHVGIHAVTQKPVRIYPNPVSDILYIEGADTGSRLEILSTSGQLVKRVENMTGNMTLDVSDMPDGMYIVRTFREEAVETIKLIK